MTSCCGSRGDWRISHFGPAAGNITFERVIKRLRGAEPDEAVCKQAEQNFTRFAAVLDQHLDGRRFLVGDRLTVAEFCIASPLTW